MNKDSVQKKSEITCTEHEVSEGHIGGYPKDARVFTVERNNEKTQESRDGNSPK